MKIQHWMGSLFVSLLLLSHLAMAALPNNITNPKLIYSAYNESVILAKTSPNGKILVYATEPGKIKIVSLESGKVLSQFNLNGEAHNIEFSENGNQFLIASAVTIQGASLPFTNTKDSSELSIFNLSTRSRLTVKTSLQLQTSHLSKDGETLVFLATSSSAKPGRLTFLNLNAVFQEMRQSNQNARMIDIEEASAKGFLRNTTLTIESTDASDVFYGLNCKEGECVAVRSLRQRIAKIFYVNQSKEVSFSSQGQPLNANDFLVSKDHQSIAFKSKDLQSQNPLKPDQLLTVLDLKKETLHFQLSTKSPGLLNMQSIPTILSYLVSKNNRFFVGVSGSGEAKIIDDQNKFVSDSLYLGGTGAEVELISENGKLLLLKEAHGKLKLINIASRPKVITEFEFNRVSLTKTFTKDSRFLIAGSQDGLMKIINTANGETKEIRLNEAVQKVIMLDDDRNVMVFTADGKLSRIKIETDGSIKIGIPDWTSEECVGNLTVFVPLQNTMSVLSGNSGINVYHY